MISNEYYQGLEPKCIGVEQSPTYQITVKGPTDPEEESRKQYLMKLKASTQLFGYKGLSRKNPPASLFGQTDEFQISAGVSVFSKPADDYNSNDGGVSSNVNSPFKRLLNSSGTKS